MKMPWMRVRNDLMEDHRVRLLIVNNEEPFVVFMRILLQSGYHRGTLRFSNKEDESGIFTDERLAKLCGISVEKMKEVIDILIYNNLIEKKPDGTIEVYEASRWFKSCSEEGGGMSTSAERMRRLRAKRKAKSERDKCDVTSDTSHASHVTVEYKNKEYKNKDKDIINPLTPKGVCGGDGEDSQHTISSQETGENQSHEQTAPGEAYPKFAPEPPTQGGDPNRRHCGRIPTRDEVMVGGRAMGIAEELAAEFYEEMSRTDWVYTNRNGATVFVGVTNFKSVVSGWDRARKAGLRPTASGAMGRHSIGVIQRDGDAEKACAACDTKYLDGLVGLKP